MPPLIIPNIAALKDYVGKPLGTSDWHCITQEQIDAFADATGDHQWIHVDIERALRESPFDGKTVAHGYLTLSLAPVLIPTILEVAETSMAVNYGVEKVRFPKPVPAGSRVQMDAVLQSVRDIPGGAARASYQLTIRVEGARKAACKAEVVYVYYPVKT